MTVHRLPLPLLPIALLLAGLATSPASIHRAVWFWGSTELSPGVYSPHGSIDIVGAPALEDAAVSFMNAYGVKRVYGSYQNRPVSEPGTIESWNAKLDAAGIQSQLLIDGSAEILESGFTTLETKVLNRLVYFNDGALPDEQFDALHLDLEPQKLSAEWDAGTAADKRALLDDLLSAYVFLRDLLDANGYSSVPVYADIPFTWDKLPIDGGSIGWLDATDRNAWYSALGSPLAGISIMTFSKDTVPEIKAATLFERTGPFAGEARIGIQAKVGPTEMWTTLGAFDAIVNGLESDPDVGTSQATDIENYAFWRDAFPPVEFVTDAVITVANGVGTVISHPFKPGEIYVIRQSTDLVHWKEYRRYRSSELGRESGIARVPVPSEGSRGFFTISRIPDYGR